MTIRGREKWTFSWPDVAKFLMAFAINSRRNSWKGKGEESRLSYFNEWKWSQKQTTNIALTLLSHAAQNWLTWVSEPFELTWKIIYPESYIQKSSGAFPARVSWIARHCCSMSRHLCGPGDFVLILLLFFLLPTPSCYQKGEICLRPLNSLFSCRLSITTFERLLRFVRRKQKIAEQ